MTRRRLVPLAIVAMLALAGCAPAAPDVATDGDPEAAATAFLTALADRDYAGALALSTLSDADLTCPAMADEPPGAAIMAPEVLAVEVDGQRATADVSYSIPAEITEQLELVQTDGQWLVSPPETWRISIGFDEPVAAELTISGECTLPVVDGGVTTFAWPGAYDISVDDPSGGAGWGKYLYKVPDGTSVPDADLTAIPAAPEGN